jgi:hypothetical protein
VCNRIFSYTLIRGHIPIYGLTDIKAYFLSVAKERLVNWMKVRHLGGDLVRRTESFQSERMVEMIIAGNPIKIHLVEAVVPQGSPVTPILFAICTSGVIELVKEYVLEVDDLSFEGNLGWVATRSDVNHVVSIRE